MNLRIDENPLMGEEVVLQEVCERHPILIRRTVDLNVDLAHVDPPVFQLSLLLEKWEYRVLGVFDVNH